jgi:signal transduction histidine kinase
MDGTRRERTRAFWGSGGTKTSREPGPTGMSAKAGLWDVETTAQQLAQQIMQTVPATIVSVALWDQPNLSLTVKGVSAARSLASRPWVGARVPLGSAHWHRVVFEEHRPVLLGQEAQTQTMSLEEARLSLVPNLRSIYLAPILVGEDIVGVLGLGEMRSSQREPFSEEKQQRCRAALEGFVAASAHVWEASRLRRQLRAMSSLLRLVRHMLGTRSLEGVLGALASELADWLGTPVRGLLLRAVPPAGMVVAARWHLPETVAEEGPAQVLLAVSRAERRGQWPVSVVSLEADPLDPFHVFGMPGGPWTRVTLPLMRGDQLAGVACLYVEDDLRPTEWELEAFQRRAEVAAVGMEVVSALEEHRGEKERLARTIYDLLDTQQRAILREAMVGVMHRLTIQLPGAMGLVASEDRGTVADAQSEAERQALAEFVVAKVTGMLTELVDSTECPADAAPPVEINQLVRQAIEIARVKWEEAPKRQGISVDLSFEPATEPVLVETSMSLMGVLIHAIENAVEAMPDGGRIQVRTARENGHVLISVADTGPGIVEEVRREAFTPLFSTKGGHHLGLGLSMARAFVVRHGGEVTLDSGEGGGTILTVRLPVTRSSA